MDTVLNFNEYIIQQEILGIFNEAQIDIFVTETNMFKSILNENNIYSINEGFGEKLKKLKEIVVKFFSGLIKKVKEFFDGIIKKIKEIFSKTKIKDNKIVHEGTVDRTLKKALDFFRYYDGTEIAFGEFPLGNPLEYFHKNSNNCFNVFREKANYMASEIKTIYKTTKNYHKEKFDQEIKEMREKIKSENEKVKTNCIHYMLSDGSKTDESHFSQDLINFYTGANGKLKMSTITSDKLDTYTIQDVYDAAFEGKRWLKHINDQYKTFLESLDKYKEEAESVADSEDSPVLTEFLSYVTTVTNLGLSIIRAGNQINNHWRVIGLQICQKILSEYNKLNASANS